MKIFVQNVSTTTPVIMSLFFFPRLITAGFEQANTMAPKKKKKQLTHRYTHLKGEHRDCIPLF